MTLYYHILNYLSTKGKACSGLTKCAKQKDSVCGCRESGVQKFPCHKQRLTQYCVFLNRCTQTFFFDFFINGFNTFALAKPLSKPFALVFFLCYNLYYV